MGNSFIFIPFILADLAALAFGLTAWQRSRFPGSLSFSLMMLAAAAWLFCALMEHNAPQAVEKILWTKISYLGITTVSAFWTNFALEFTLSVGTRYRRWRGLLVIIPVITLLLVATNEQHGLIWSKIISSNTPGGISLDYYHGLWFWIFVVYSYLLLAWGLIVIIRGMLRFPQSRRRQTVVILAAMLPPWLLNAIYLTGPNPLGYDITPYGLVISGLVFAVSVFRVRLFDRTPLAHEAVLENFRDGYLVIDNKGRVFDANPRACQFLGLEGDRVQGQPVEAVLSNQPRLANLLRSEELAVMELLVRQDPPLYLEASVSPWFGRNQQPSGRILILRDITGQKQVEEKLRRSERQYRLLVHASPVGITMTDENGIVNYISPAVYGLYHLPHEAKPSGKPVLHWVDPIDRPMAIMRMFLTLEDRKSLPPQVYHMQRADGSTFWAEITSTPILDDEGEANGLLITTRDVTPAKELETRLKQHLSEQTFINDLLQMVFRADDISQALSQMMERTGVMTGASRIVLCRDVPDGSETVIEQEWCVPGVRPRAHEGALVRYKAIPTWQQWMLEQGIVIAPDQDSVPADIAEFMATWNIRSLAAFPIYGSENDPYGFLGLEFVDQPREFQENELDLLLNACRIISGAISQRQVQAAEHRQRILAEALHDTSSALNRTLNSDEVLDRILTNLTQVVQHDAASIAMIDPDGMVRFVRWRGYDDEGDALMRNLRLNLAERETYRWMLLTGEPVIISDTWADRRWIKSQAYSWIRSYAGVPIQIKDQVVGFINLDSEEPDVFSTDLAYSLHVFADQAANAIENARLYNDARLRAEEMSTLYRIGQTITALLEMDQVLVSLCDQCRQVLPIDVFYVALYDAATNRIDVPLYYNDGVFETIASYQLEGPCGATGEIIRRRRTIYIPDTMLPEVDEEYHLRRLGGRPTRSFVGVPLISPDQVVGVISMQNYLPQAYTPEQVRLLETIGAQAAMVVQNARLFNQTKQMAITDTVTQLYTRRHFTDLGTREVERTQRYQRTLSVLMVDIDRFKRVNDTYGHKAGDQVLQMVAANCQKALRATDIVGRWGGEEIAIVLPEADLHGAALIAERIRRMVNEAEVTVGQMKIQVTVSIGVAALREGCETLEQMIDCADRAMYAAKQSGRNQVRTILEVPSEP